MDQNGKKTKKTKLGYCLNCHEVCSAPISQFSPLNLLHTLTVHPLVALTTHRALSHCPLPVNGCDLLLLLFDSVLEWERTVVCHIFSTRRRDSFNDAVCCQNSIVSLPFQTTYRGIKNPEAVERKRKKQEEAEKQAMSTSASGGGGLRVSRESIHRLNICLFQLVILDAAFLSHVFAYLTVGLD